MPLIQGLKHTTAIKKSGARYTPIERVILTLYAMWGIWRV
jgi:hypothetical protein